MIPPSANKSVEVNPEKFEVLRDGQYYQLVYDPTSDPTIALTGSPNYFILCKRTSKIEAAAVQLSGGIHLLDDCDKMMARVLEGKAPVGIDESEQVTH